jgi:hypothetical protein
MTLCAPNALQLNPLPVSNVVAGAYVSQDITTSNGTGPFEFSVTALTLPPGLSLYLGGWLTGYASTIGTYDFVVQAMDSLGCTGSRLYTMNVFTCTANIQASPASLSSGNVGMPYNRTISGSGGTPPYTFSIFDGTFPPGLFLDNLTGSITGTPTSAGSFSFTIRVSDSNQCFADIPYTINITIPVCLLCDEFDDNVLRSDFSYLKGNWNEMGGSLTGTASGKALAVAMPAFNGCTTCSFETTMKSGGEKVWFFTWYKDSKSRVELLMDPATDKWIFKQYANGNVVAKRKVTKTIDTNTVYKVKMLFNGTNFEVYIDDVLSITIAAGATPFGTAAFQSKATSGSFGYLRIN